MSVSRPGGDFWVAPAEIDPVDLYGAAGVGVFVGFVGSVLSHVWDGAALPILAFAYLIGMSRFRGWKEYAALLSMASTVVLYYSAYDVVTLLSLNVWGIVAVVAATILATFVCGMAVAAYSGHARKNVRATPPRGPGPNAQNRASRLRCGSGAQTAMPRRVSGPVVQTGGPRWAHGRAALSPQAAPLGARRAAPQPGPAHSGHWPS